MQVSLRAAISVLLLAGFYVVALAIVTGLGAVAAFAYSHGSGSAGTKFAIAAIVVAGGLVAALWKVARAKPAVEPGVEVTRAQAPELWDIVDRLATEVGTRGPEQILLVGDVNAAVSEDARLLGLVGGTRRLYLGVPLLLGLDVAQLRAVLGHELGHYSSSHTRLGPVAYRGRQTITATISQVSGVAGWILTQYAKLYVLASQSAGRSQELEADRVMGAVAGPRIAQSALMELPVLDSAWNFYLGQYALVGWEAGLAPAPEEFFAGFAHLLSARAEEIAGLRDQTPPSERSRWDSHPPIAERVRRLENMPAGDVAEPDPRPAWALLPGFSALATTTAEETIAYGDRERLRFPDLVARALADDGQHRADAAYRAVARIAGVPTATLETALTLAAAGRLPDVARALVPDAPADQLPELTQQVCSTLLEAAVVQSGAAAWRLSWSEPAALALPDGRPLELDPLAEGLAAATPDDAALRAQDVRDRLAGIGADPARAGQVETRASARGGDIVGGIADVKVDGVAHDLLVLDVGLVLAQRVKASLGARTLASQTGSDDGKRRLAALAQSASPAELAQTHRFIAFEDVAHASLDSRIVLKATLRLHDGTVVTLKEPATADRLGKDVFQDVYGLLMPYTGTAVASPG